MLTWGREVTGDLAAAERREWLCVNGIGGFASGTIAGTQTRRYHGLLIAALAPPLGRTLLAAQVHDTLAYAGRDWALCCARWASGNADPAGYRLIERFRLDGTTPVWTYACADALVEKRVWMEPGANTTYVRWRVLRGQGPLTLTVKALVNYRDYHATTRAGDWRMDVAGVPEGLRVTAFAGERGDPQALRYSGHVHAPIAGPRRCVVVAVIDERLDRERQGSLAAQHAPAHVGRVGARLHPDALFDERVGARVGPDGRRAVEAEALDEPIPRGIRVATRPASAAQRPVASGVGQRVVNLGREQRAAQRRRQRGDQKAVIAPGLRAGDRARREAPDAVDAEPFAPLGGGEIARHLSTPGQHAARTPRPAVRGRAPPGTDRVS